MNFIDLHLHLYGCLSPDMLFEIGRKNPRPKWERFLDFYEMQYGTKINPDTFWNDYAEPEKFKELYLFNHRAPFACFQAKFNLIIALIQFDEKEIFFVSKEVALQHFKEGVNYAEYRLMFSPFETKQNYYSKIKAACNGLKYAEMETGNSMTARLILSLHRDGNYEEAYHWLKEFQNSDPIVSNYLVGIDFCNVEEGNPPKLKKDFFERVKKDNQKNPDTSLSILYHVGESFTDKSPKSAVRWVIESAKYGADRLGHCIVLGRNANNYLGNTFIENASERKDQLQFEIENYDELQKFGSIKELPELKNELSKIRDLPDDSKLEIYADSDYTKELETLQEYGLNLIKNSNSVIETCPTSNLYIGMIESMKDHPIHRFLKAGVKLTIASDDPGIFDTNISKEYELVKSAGVDNFRLEKLRTESFVYISRR